MWSQTQRWLSWTSRPKVSRWMVGHQTNVSKICVSYTYCTIESLCQSLIMSEGRAGCVLNSVNCHYKLFESFFLLYHLIVNELLHQSGSSLKLWQTQLWLTNKVPSFYNSFLIGLHVVVNWIAKSSIVWPTWTRRKW
jgi:hypothetical protein